VESFAPLAYIAIGLAGLLLARRGWAWWFRRVEHRIQEDWSDAADYSADPPQPFPRVSRLRAASVVFLAAYPLFLSAVVGALVLAGLVSLYALRAFLGVSYVAVLACLTVGLALAARLRCPRCTRSIASEHLTPRYPLETFGGLRGWGATALKVALRRPFRCRYCGQRFSAEPIATAHIARRPPSIGSSTPVM